ncbi:MAG TPA: hypothetical protein VN697_12430 [Tepidiformaceae bacterium]|jgi:hypothetical protein|nr:hypothetical protein [Tepidiformaceae bacterium]
MNAATNSQDNPTRPIVRSGHGVTVKVTPATEEQLAIARKAIQELSLQKRNAPHR